MALSKDKPGRVILHTKSEPAEYGLRCFEQVTVNYSGLPYIDVYSSESVECPCESGEQGYHLYRVDEERLVIISADDAGAMYALLDLRDHLLAYGSLNSFKTGIHKPFIKNRGIKFNIPLDARTPSYTDCGDSARQNIANMWDMDFWRATIDHMADNRLNMLSLWNLSPFPSLVRVPEYPETALDDVQFGSVPSRGTTRGQGFLSDLTRNNLITIKTMSMDKKVEFWRNVMEYAESRCVSVYLFTWNVHVYGTEGTGYGITDEADNPVTKDYIRKAVKALLQTYPLLAGIGVTAGENMRREWLIDQSEDLRWVMDTYGVGINEALETDPDRPFTLIQRQHMTTVEQIEQAFADFAHDLELSYKYSIAHMHSTIKPCFGDSFFSQLNNSRKAWLTVRNDDFYMLRWGDPDFAREYLKEMPHEHMKGIYYGSDGYIWGKDYLSRSPSMHGIHYFEKNWYWFAIWGRLSYDIHLPDSYFTGLLSARYGENAGYRLFEIFKHSSKAIPLLQRVFWNDYDFNFYPEACCRHIDEENQIVFCTVDFLIESNPCPGSGHISIREYCRDLTCEAVSKGITPDQAADEMRSSCVRALEILYLLSVDDIIDSELLNDLRAMSLLGMYYADKIQCAVNILCYRLSKQRHYREKAIFHAEGAYSNWVKYSSNIALRYYPQNLGRLRGVVSPDIFDYWAEMDITIARQIYLTD